MFNLNEDTLKALHTRLTTNLNAVIDTANSTLTTPSFPLDYPTQVFDYIPPIGELADFPIVAIGDGTIDFQDDVGWSATGVMDFVVCIWVHEFEPRALAWKLRRMMACVANCVLLDRDLDGAGWGVTLGKIEPGPTLGRRENPKEMVGMRAMTLTVRDEQDA